MNSSYHCIDCTKMIECECMLGNSVTNYSKPCLLFSPDDESEELQDKLNASKQIR